MMKYKKDAQRKQQEEVNKQRKIDILAKARAAKAEKARKRKEEVKGNDGGTKPENSKQ